jgi:hypothetical protein
MIHSICAVKFFPFDRLAETRVWIEGNSRQNV